MSVRLISAGVAVAVLGTAAPAFACKPAQNYQFTLLDDTTPDCLGVDPIDGYEYASIVFRNECEDPFSLAASDCDGCLESSLQLDPGETAELVVEDRELASTSAQSFVWNVGNGFEGTLRTEVTYADNSGACDDFDSALCATSPDGTPQGVPAVLFALFLGMFFRRRYSKND